MERLAKALLALDWSEMDSFAQMICSVSVDDHNEPNDERYISGALVDWAQENIEPDDEQESGH